ncbi:hypothetical protein D3C73_1531010 [compost metagenome]
MSHYGETLNQPVRILFINQRHVGIDQIAVEFLDVADLDVIQLGDMLGNTDDGIVILAADAVSLFVLPIRQGQQGDQF